MIWKRVMGCSFAIFSVQFFFPSSYLVIYPVLHKQWGIPSSDSENVLLERILNWQTVRNSLCSFFFFSFFVVVVGVWQSPSVVSLTMGWVFYLVLGFGFFAWWKNEMRLLCFTFLHLVYALWCNVIKLYWISLYCIYFLCSFCLLWQ